MTPDHIEQGCDRSNRTPMAHAIKDTRVSGWYRTYCGRGVVDDGRPRYGLVRGVTVERFRTLPVSHPRCRRCERAMRVAGVL